MKFNLKYNNGYNLGLSSGVFWAINAALLSFILSQEEIPNFGLYIPLGVILVAFIHDSFSAITLFIFKIKLNNLKKLKIRKHYYLSLSGFLAGPVGLTCYLLAIKYLGVAVATSTVAIYPVIIAMVLSFFFGEKIKKYTILSILLTVIGCIGVNLFSANTIFVEKIFMGIFFSVICVFTWSFECIVVDRLSNDDSLDSSVMLFVRQLSSALLYLIIISFIIDFDYSVFSMFNYSLVSWILFASLFATLSYLTWYSAIDKLGAPIATLLNVTYSFWGVCISYLFLNQYVDIPMFISMCLILSGVSILLVNKNKGLE
ncbi:DMT family transporter [Photobacterium leiognathi]|uniref:DMT family transporter n=1 Tax=Photobacterium leiognathi TaxID=553611 RepID=UPI002982671D|nr:DMT family transporter [Photobacterium leiognathi]